MAHSKLATKHVAAYWSAKDPNYTKGRLKKVSTCTLHHMAATLTSEECGNIFAKKGRHGSAHYGVGKNGDIAWYVDEKDTAWSDSNWESNKRTISVELSDKNKKWEISDKTWKAAVKLFADIAKRNKLGKLKHKKNFFVHRDLAATACPGDWMNSRIDKFLAEVNAINYAKSDTKKSTALKKGDKVVPKKLVDYTGHSVIAHNPYYIIDSISGDRAVLRTAKGVIWAALNINNLKKA